ncbi:MAG TPA: NADPH-dependent F420 reductase [Blastocatellia bacterium]|nr:NADPH-dependent F420 reductase [Blastocatellia bacterium]
MNISDLTVGLLGGTGAEGRGLALRWAQTGAKVVIGSRSRERAMAAAEDLNRILGEPTIGYDENSGVARGSAIILLSVPFEHATSTLEAHQADFRSDAIVVDATIPLTFEKGRVGYAEPPEGSGSEHLRKYLRPDIPLVAAFKTMPAHVLLDPGEPLQCDEFAAGDSKESKEFIMEAASFISGLRMIDAGGLDAAGTLERMTALAVALNRRYKRKTSRFKVIGL